jgi:hypothetical protein
MAIIYCATLPEARQINGGVIRWVSRGVVEVRTGDDIPAEEPVELVVVSRWALREALFAAGKLDDADAAALTQSAMRQRLWNDSATFGRNWRQIINLQQKMAAFNAADMDLIFRAAQAMQPSNI